MPPISTYNTASQFNVSICFLFELVPTKLHREDITDASVIYQRIQEGGNRLIGLEKKIKNSMAHVKQQLLVDVHAASAGIHVLAFLSTFLSVIY